MEWINLRQIFREVFSYFGLSDQVNVDNIAFSWSYDRNLATHFYKPSDLFKHFSFIHLLDPDDNCVCMTVRRFRSFIDPLTVHECSDYSKPAPHVRTMDLRIVQNPKLRAELARGLNHIPLSPTDLNQAVHVTLDAFARLYCLLRLQDYGLALHEASAYCKQLCVDKLYSASRSNRFGFKSSGPALFSHTAVNDELKWLLTHLYVSGLDKASNNPCFICIKHIRLQAFHRLSSEDFTPCMSGKYWEMPSSVLEVVRNELIQLLPEAPPVHIALPFLMASYKQHKLKYRWLTNAFHTIYTNIASILTIATMEVLEAFRTWARKTVSGYRNFLGIDTSIFWMVDSILQVTLNLPHEMSDVYVADITKCFESIPLTGPDNLLDSIKFVLKTGYREASSMHPKSITKLWIKISQDASPSSARWDTIQPRYGQWIEMPLERLLVLHSWLMNNCMVTLGDRVWKQTKGIPMGFSCSPLWCNIYLTSYEVKFIQRLATLGRTDLMAKFRHAFRYIDDICLLNVQNPHTFLDPMQPRNENNPFWIYPLHVLEIKPRDREICHK